MWNAKASKCSGLAKDHQYIKKSNFVVLLKLVHAQSPCLLMCKTPNTSKRLPMPALLFNMQLHVPIKDFVIATATIVLAICFFGLSCFILIKHGV